MARQEFPWLGWVRLSDFRAVQAVQVVFALRTLSSFSPKCATFCMDGLFVELLLCHALSLGTLHLTDWGRWGAPAALPVTFRPGPWGLFTECCLLAKQEPGLWGSEGH